jgi:hypothetical protein
VSILSNTTWQGEPLKLVINFGNNIYYTVYSDKSYDPNTNNFIKDADFSLSEGNTNVNPLGIAVSNNINLKVYDEDDALSPANINSIYYGKTVNGVEMKLYISYDGLSWDPYGTYYATAWSGGFEDGWHGLVNISAEDKLNTIGNLELPELPAYADIQAGDLIANVMNAIGISSSEYTIDPSINKSMMFGITAGNKVRDFFNNICQLLLARVIIDRQDIIRFVPSLSIYNTGNELDINGDYTGTLINKNTNNIIYNKVAVKYLEGGSISRGVIFNDSSHTLSVGNNTITDITFSHRALSIEQVRVLFDSNKYDSNIEDLNYRGYQNGIQLNINVSGEDDILECNIYGEGLLISTTDRYITVDIDNSSIIGGRTYEFDTKQMMGYSQASAIATDLKSYISTISRNIIMRGTALTPKLYIGDKVVISNTNTLYNGTYKVIEMGIRFGENYSLDLTLIRIG